MGKTALITGQDNTHHQGTTEGKGERRKEKGEGRGSDAEAASEGIFLDPPPHLPLSLSLSLCAPHPPGQDNTPTAFVLCFDPPKEQKKYEQPSPAILSEELLGPFFVTGVSPAFLATTRPPR